MPKIRDELRAQRQEEILRAAAESLVAHGYTGTSMRTIAEAVGTTKGALYAYYPNKEAILLALAGRYTDIHLGKLEPREGVRAEAQLRGLLEGYRRLSGDTQRERAQGAILDFWIHARGIPAVQAVLDERYRRTLATLASLVRRCREEGAVREDVDPELAAGLLLAAVDGMFFQKLKLGGPVPIAALTRTLEALLFESAAASADPERT